MREKSWIFFILLLLSYVLCLVLVWRPASARTLVLFSLAAAVLLSLELLLAVLGRYNFIQTILLLAVMIMLYFKFGANMMPVYSMILAILSEKYFGYKHAYYPAATLTALLLLISAPRTQLTLLTVFLTAITFIIIYITNRMDVIRTASKNKSLEITQLRKNLADQKRATRAMEETVKLKERNRIAARIHDDLGHGISGSILLLEGAMLVMDKQPEDAKKTISYATDHLRSSVDDIRKSLREERSTREEAGLAELKAELARLSSHHTSVETTLQTEGAVDEIPPPVWYCIHENTKEAITNLLKHSHATKFTVSIKNQNKLLLVELKDNGKVNHYKSGIGLQNMEERCGRHNGSCYFQGNSNGFKITMVFKGGGIRHDENTFSR